MNPFEEKLQKRVAETMASTADFRKRVETFVEQELAERREKKENLPQEASI